MRVFRIEHPKTREGPYNMWSGDFNDHEVDLLIEITRDHDGSEGHPGMRDMSPTLSARYSYYGHDIIKFFSGFENAEQAWDWFGRDGLESLKDLGFLLQVYETKGAKLRDGKQVAFLRDKSKLIHGNAWDLIGIS